MKDKYNILLKNTAGVGFLIILLSGLIEILGFICGGALWFFYGLPLKVWVFYTGIALMLASCLLLLIISMFEKREDEK